MTDLETILSWFQTGDMPTQKEFQQTFSSFRHTNTKIPITEVDGLEASLNNKVNVGDIIDGGGEKSIPLTGTTPESPASGLITVQNEGGRIEFGKNGVSNSHFLATEYVNSDQVFFMTNIEEGINTSVSTEDFNTMNELKITKTFTRLSAMSAGVGTVELDIKPKSFKVTTSDATGGGSNKITEITQNGIRTEALTNAQGDPSFNRKLVQKNTGEIGYIEVGIKETGQINSEDFIMSGGSSANGVINFEHQEGSEYVTIRFRLSATIKDENIYIPLPFGIGISNLKRFANFGFNDQFINISSQEQVIILSKLNFAGDLSVYINECIVFPYGYEGAQD
ncbi:hypothetical protein [Chryseobacterium indoltheticum]|uniref:Uncharacterized protein n=1 Tax=Chryseobacterium indoltheticum TaxID=254 RepID=A0A381F4C5_9FLAO|nr:hypothetical protein [Chryseobacterium indoltheticum]AZA74952.1 hypothetical protein EG358_14790 [Chryseobacterium indoltheticum]SIQ61099.1 hypothetical protein SAMN05421682_106237 [Chryseobacterium indoltheticum]SUX41406.1 Uncharacterised protein [Chryseobacterium indoltheticum]